MNDEPESPDVAEVRRLLAEARHTEPMPDDVAARLDDVLAGLGRSTASTTSTPAETAPPVVSLSARRRRTAAGWVLAAAAVVVGAVVVVPHLGHGPSPSPSAGSRADDAAGNTGNATSPPKHTEQTTPGPQGAKPVVVRPRHFTADALRTRQQLADAKLSFDSAKATQVCAGVPGGHRSVAAEYRNSPAALVYLRPQGGSQTVYLYLCGQGQPVRSATLPVP